jgi:flagellar L-ring protein FlgH
MAALRSATVLLALSLAGCATLNGEVKAPTGDDMPDITWDPPHGTSGGVFVPGSVRSITSDNRAYRVGDVLTVELDESTAATNSNKTAISKDAKIGMDSGQLFGSAVDLATNLGLDRESTASGTTTQNNSLAGSVTVIVKRVLPNGLLQIVGEKSLMLNQNVESVRLSGYLRPSDIDGDNRVSSQRIANARIAYSGRGSIASANRSGWLARFFNHPLMPF